VKERIGTKFLGLKTLAIIFIAVVPGATVTMPVKEDQIGIKFADKNGTGHNKYLKMIRPDFNKDEIRKKVFSIKKSCKLDKHTAR
jgi:hypothetical protein